MKKWMSCLLAVLVIFAISGCSDSLGKSKVSPAGTVSASVVSPPAQSALSEPASEESGPEASVPDLSVPNLSAPDSSEAGASLAEDGSYTTKEDVALYLHLYRRLPDNFITKKEARELGWEGGGLEPYAPGKCMGGSHFGNYDGQLPEKEGRTYRECDIDTLGKSKRGPKRIIYSNDGLVYYTQDHYETFELLYGEE